MDQQLTENYHPASKKPRLLVAPLDWGLGHATRCIPVIKELLVQDCEVWIASQGPQKRLLELEFPGLSFLDLEGYGIRYARSGASLSLKILGQGRKILKAIRHENAWLKQIVRENPFDAVISDNRYGLYHPDIPSIFMTHQLLIKTPLGKWSERILQKKNYHYINRFKECWIPDHPGKNNLAGDLSHPQHLPAIPIRYVGPLSRFHQQDLDPTRNHLVVILSGPEPQRTILENKVLKEIVNFPGTAAIIRGLPGFKSIIPSTDSLRFYNHMETAQLNEEIMKAGLVLCRSGYSTIMDLAHLQKRSVLLATPGQTEQEYLANYLADKKLACAITPKKFSLSKAIEKANTFSYQPFPETDGTQLKRIVSEFLKSLTV